VPHSTQLRLPALQELEGYQGGSADAADEPCAFPALHRKDPPGCPNDRGGPQAMDLHLCRGGEEGVLPVIFGRVIPYITTEGLVLMGWFFYII
jgi:hypothetical protein